MKNKLIAAINSWFNFESATNEDYGDVTVDMARANYNQYEQDIKRQQQKYIKELCEEIKLMSRAGKLSTMTLDTREADFMTYDFIKELDSYFKSKGFITKEEGTNFSNRVWLRISWNEVKHDD